MAPNWMMAVRAVTASASPEAEEFLGDGQVSGAGDRENSVTPRRKPRTTASK